MYCTQYTRLGLWATQPLTKRKWRKDATPENPCHDEGSLRRDRYMPCKKMSHFIGREFDLGLEVAAPDSQDGKGGIVPGPEKDLRPHLPPHSQLVQPRVFSFAARSAFSAITSNCPGIGLPVLAAAASKACFALTASTTLGWDASGTVVDAAEAGAAVVPASSGFSLSNRNCFALADGRCAFSSAFFRLKISSISSCLTSSSCSAVAVPLAWAIRACFRVSVSFSIHRVRWRRL